MKKILKSLPVKNNRETTQTQFENGILYGFRTGKADFKDGRKELSINLRTFLPSELSASGYMHLIEHIKAAPFVSRVQKEKLKDKIRVSANTSYSPAQPLSINFEIIYSFYSFDKKISSYETPIEEIKEAILYIDDILAEYITNFKVRESEGRVQQEIPIILSEKTWCNTDEIDELSLMYASTLDKQSKINEIQIQMANKMGIKLFTPRLISIIGLESEIKDFNAKTLNKILDKLMLRENTAFSVSRDIAKIEGLEFYNSSMNKFIKNVFPKTKKALDSLGSIEDVKHYYKSMVDYSKIFTENVTLNTSKRKDIEFIINPDKLKVTSNCSTIGLTFNFNFKEKLKRFTLVPHSEMNIREIVRKIINKSVVSFLRENNIPIYSFDYFVSPMPEFEAIHLPYEPNDLMGAVSFKDMDKDEVNRIVKFLNTEYRKYLIKIVEDMISSDFKELKDNERITCSNGHYNYIKMLNTFDLVLQQKNYKNNPAIEEIREYIKPYISDSYHLYESLEKELNDKDRMKEIGNILLSSVKGMTVSLITYRN